MVSRFRRMLCGDAITAHKATECLCVRLWFCIALQPLFLAGLSQQPSPHIGSTRQLRVPDRGQQAQQMMHAAQHHAPDVLVVDELCTPQDVAAAMQISRSHNVLLVAGAPAASLQQLLQDNTLSALVGCERQAGRVTTDGWGGSSSASTGSTNQVRTTLRPR